MAADEVSPRAYAPILSSGTVFLDLTALIRRISVLLLLKTDTKKTTRPRILG